MTKISIFVTSDTHGQWIEREDYHGLSLIDTAMTLKNLRDTCDHPTLTIDLGDFIQGSGLATYYSQERKDGTMFAKVMNALTYDVQLMGNHEFNFGMAYRQRIFEQLNAPILAANIIDERTGQPYYGQPFRIFERSGIKIGVLGVTTSYIKHWELPENYKGLDILDAYETTKKYVEELRPQVDILCVAYHGGFEKDLATFEAIEPLTGENQGAQMIESIPGIDILLTGHQHRQLAGMSRGVVYLQPGYGGEFIGRIDIELDNEGQVINMTPTNIPVLDKQVAAKWLHTALEPEYSEGRRWLQTSIGYSKIQSPTNNPFEARLYGHPYAELLNQIQLQETGAQFSSVAIVNDFFSHLVGEVTQEKLLQIYPFFNLIATVKVTGQDLYDIMEHNMTYFSWTPTGELRINPSKLDPKPQHYNLDLYSGFTSVIDLTQPFGYRVIELMDEKTGKAIEREQEYLVAVSQYRAVGGGNYLNYSEDKILNISDVDIASRLKEKLNQLTPEDWHTINHHYQHIQLVHQPTLSNSPEDISDMTVIETYPK